MKNTQAVLTFIAIFAALTAMFVAPGRARSQGWPGAIVSPEIHPDRTVTFRLKAPAATEVKMWGDWDGKGNEMAKDATGIWSVTLGPLAADIYSYSFNVDGVTMIDPSNPISKPMRAVMTSLLTVPGDKPALWDQVPGVPRGTVYLHDYDSKSLGKTRRLRVYTPASYDPKSKTRYPVLYLFHGSGDNEATWTECGRANVILDNLIAAGKVKPMIVVMTDGHASFSSGAGNRGAFQEAFDRDFLQDVMPFVESRYRIRADREDRAIAGLSMGGFQSLDIGLNHRDLFAWVIGMSSDVPNAKTVLAPFWADPNSAKTPLRLLWFSDGTEDFLLKGNQALDVMLTEKNVPHKFVQTPGSHTWLVWRRDLTMFAPLLFIR